MLNDLIAHDFSSANVPVTKNPWACSDQTASAQMVLFLAPDRAEKRYVGMSHWLSHTSMQPPETQVQRQSTSLLKRKKSMLILMADIFFEPIAIETLGVFNTSARQLLFDLGSKIT